jgi:hypothetical protein
MNKKYQESYIGVYLDAKTLIINNISVYSIIYYGIAEKQIYIHSIYI